MKRKATPEQRQAAKEKRQAMHKLAAEVASWTPEKRAELVERIGAVVTVDGHALSTYNTIMAAYQSNGEISIVGGFRQWKRVGRAVRKGERGISIWYPAKPKSKKANDTDEADEIDTDEKGVRMALGTVFDITQTDPIDTEAKA